MLKCCGDENFKENFPKEANNNAKIDCFLHQNCFTREAFVVKSLGHKIHCKSYMYQLTSDVQPRQKGGN